MTDRVLSAEELNRAMLERQMLLERTASPPTEAIERLVALQAQEPASPAIALWTRIEGFRAADLDHAFLLREVVKGTVMRATLHAVTALDYLYYWPAVAPSIRAWRAQQVQRFDVNWPLDQLAEQALQYAAEPRSGTEMRRYLEREAAAESAAQLDPWWAVGTHAPFLRTPSDGARSFGHRPMFVAARTWLDGQFCGEEDGVDHLIRRYLAGYGPATLGDIFQFSRVTRPRLWAGLERLAPELRSFRNEAGGILYDVLDGPLPPADTKAPPRLLPMWDSVLLAYEDRSRVIPDAHRRRIVQPNGDFLPAFMVDGRVAGLWRADVVNGRTRITTLPFGPIARAADRALQAEARRLAAFVEPIEPAVYKRYVNTWLK